MNYKPALILLAFFACACTAPQHQPGPPTDPLRISVLATNDTHGELLLQEGRGGLTTLSGYVAALRAARDADNGGVLLIDAGDMWQGTLESNLSEGATVVEAYNALGYTAATIGNHEFDFGPAGPLATPGSNADDARGALKLRASEANFPLLAANLIDTATNLPVAWPNVTPSTMVEVAGVRVGIVGIMSDNALYTTMAANVQGLRVAPLTETVIREATRLREQGAALVIVTAHAGGRCTEFDDPLDLSSCDLSGEIMRVASELPPGLVDHIIAGHVHQGIAHEVNGIAVTASYSNTRAFGRVDFLIDRRSGVIKERKIYPPQRTCAFVDMGSGQCVVSDVAHDSVVAARYEGYEVIPNEVVMAIANRAEVIARARKAEAIGVHLETPITLEGSPESALGNLMTDALLAAVDADISIHNVKGGIRANLAQGDLTYGDLYQMFPFDNKMLVLQLTGAEVRRVIAHQAHNTGRYAGFSGMRVFVTCDDNQMNVDMLLADGNTIRDDDVVDVAVNDFLALGGDGILTPILPDGGFDMNDDMPLVRDALGEWFASGGGALRAEQFLDHENPRWNLPENLPANCFL